MNNFDSFDKLDLPASIRRALEAMQFVTPTPIQARAIPPALAGKDIIGTAATGTGKTGAFGVPMMANLFDRPKITGLVLAPTRELAAQIHEVLKKIGHGSKMYGALVVGGESFGRQERELAQNVDFVVATPGRLNDHLEQRTVNLSSVGILVLDEVDRMLDMGFLPQLKRILGHLPKERQTLLFSATLPPEVTRLVDGIVDQPVRVTVDDVAKPTSKVKEEILHVEQNEKNDLLLAQLRERTGKTLVFARTQSRTQRILRLLEQKGVAAVCLHGGRSQAQRKRALEDFRSGRRPVMVATDLAGRGIDVKDIDHVINYDVPGSREDYIHRIGRTGRAGAEGSAVSFVVNGDLDEETVVTGKRPRRPEGSAAPRPGGPRRSAPNRGRPGQSAHRRGASRGGEGRSHGGGSHGGNREGHYSGERRGRGGRR